jgi:hypothetical protein
MDFQPNYSWLRPVAEQKVYMEIDMNDPMFQLVSMEGVWHLLLSMSGMSAMERGSNLIEPLDLVKAIYIVDLEHVSMFWDDWRNYEKFISEIPLVSGRKGGYINRTQKLLQSYMLGRENPGQFVVLATPSQILQDIAFSARKLAQARGGEEELPSSCDLLYCACSEDVSLSEALRQAGLKVEMLGAAVKRPT